jgi:hypothetical protein
MPTHAIYKDNRGSRQSTSATRHRKATHRKGDILDYLATVSYKVVASFSGYAYRRGTQRCG